MMDKGRVLMDRVDVDVMFVSFSLTVLK